LVDRSRLSESGWDSLPAYVTEISIQMETQWNYYDRPVIDNFPNSSNTSGVDPEFLIKIPINHHQDSH